MPASIVARVVRMPVFAAVVASALAACSNDPMSPVAPRARISSSVSAAPVDAGVSATSSDGSIPWYRNSTTPAAVTTSSSDGSIPWYRNHPTPQTTATTSSDGSIPWY